VTSSTLESGGGEGGGSNQMFEMFLKNISGFVEPTEPSQTGSTGGMTRWLLEAVRPQVHLGGLDALVGSTAKDRGDSLDEEVLDSVDDNEARDELISLLLRFQCHCCQRRRPLLSVECSTTSATAMLGWCCFTPS
jgi:hypothetical protein